MDLGTRYLVQTAFKMSNIWNTMLLMFVTNTLNIYSTNKQKLNHLNSVG